MLQISLSNISLLRSHYCEFISCVLFCQVYAPLARPGESVEVGWANYQARYRRSIEDSDAFWAEQAREHLSWFSPFTRVSGGDFLSGDVHWFDNGKLNVSYNCIDRHLEAGRGGDVAILWEGDDPSNSRSITFESLSREVNRIANVLKEEGVRKGDVVTIYMPMIPELAMVMLACSRIGAVHSIVFAGFSAESLKGRIKDCNSRFVFTADQGLRGGKQIHLKQIVDEVRESCIY